MLPALPPPIATFLLTSETSAAAIIAHQQRCRTNTIQICDRLSDGTYDEIRAALKILADEIAKRGSEIIAGTPQEAAAMLKAEHERYGKLVKALGLKQQ